MNTEEEKLLAIALDKIAESFDRKAILRGGMVLRLLGSSRFTNDLDYAFSPYSSKKEIVSKLLYCLEQIDGASLEHSINSQCLRIFLKVDNTTV